MSAAVGSNKPSRDGPQGEEPSQPTGSGGIFAAVEPNYSSKTVSLSTEWVAFDPLTDWVLSEFCLEAHGFTIVSQIGGDGAYLLTGAGACFPLERPPGSRSKRITGTLVAPGEVHFSPSVAERGIRGPSISFLLDGGSDFNSAGAGFKGVLVEPMPAGPRQNASGAGGHALVARSRGRLTLVFGGAWTRARHRLRLLTDDFSSRQPLSLLFPAGTPLGELPKPNEVLDGGASWIRSQVSRVAWTRRSKLPRHAHGAMVRDLFLIADHLNVHSAPQLKAAFAGAEGVEPDLAKLVPADFQDQVSPHLLKMAVKRTPVRSQRTGASMNDLLQSSPGSEWSGWTLIPGEGPSGGGPGVSSGRSPEPAGGTEQTGKG